MFSVDTKKNTDGDDDFGIFNIPIRTDHGEYA